MRDMRTSPSGQDRDTAQLLRGQAPYIPDRRRRPEIRQHQRDLPQPLGLRREAGAFRRHPGPVPDDQEDLREEARRGDNRPLLRPDRQLPGVQLIPALVHEPRAPRHEAHAHRLRQRQLDLRQVLLHPGPEAHEVPRVQGVPSGLHPYGAPHGLRHRGRDT